MKAKLYPLAISDLNYRYARRLDDDHIRHYVISGMATMANPGKTIQDIILDHVLKHDGVEAEIAEPLYPHDKAGIQVTDVTDRLLKGYPHIKKALSKVAVKSLVHQRIVYASRLDRCKDLLAHFWYKYPYRLWCKLFRKEMPFYYAVADMTGVYHNAKHGVRKADMVRFLAYTYEEPNEELAFETLRNDLEKLYENDLILGTLAMPSTVELADTVGSGHRSRAVFCFVAVDTDRLCWLTGKSNLENPKLDDIGIPEQSEGSCGVYVGYDPKEKYEIEEVHVAFSDQDAIREKVIESFENSKDLVNDIAKKQKEYLQGTEKVSHSYACPACYHDGEDVTHAHVHVDVDLIKKGSKE